MLVKHEQLTEQIIKGFYTVYHALGYGFLEKVYENSLLKSSVLSVFVRVLFLLSV